jgi:cytochrome c5
MRRYRKTERPGPAGRALAGSGGTSRFWIGRRTLRRRWLVLSVLVGLVLAELAVWGWYVLRPEPGPSVMTAESCSRSGCHTRDAEEASIFVAVDGSAILPNQPVDVKAGDPFEVDFHFTGVVGDPDRFSRVGMEIVVPEDPPWRVSAGTLGHPEEWSLSGLGANLWSPAWDRADNGNGPTIAEWVQSPDRPNAYYLSWGATAATTVATIPVGEESILRNTISDRGGADSGDPDGIAGHSGADALITVPMDTKPGLYQVEISGVGHTSSGKRGKVSAMITVSVTEPLSPAPASTTERISAVDVYQEYCTGCHGATPNTALIERLTIGEAAIAQAIREGTDSMPPYASSAGGPLSEEEIQGLVQYLLNRAELAQVPGARPIPHDIAGASDCLSCHGGNKLPDGHDTYDSGDCLRCHNQGPEWMKGPPMVHSPEVGQDCLRCHVAGAAIGVPATHAGRTNETCQLCHQPGPQIPTIPHAIPPQLICLTCHGPQGQVPVPASHAGRGEDVCLACHRRSSQIVSSS